MNTRRGTVVPATAWLAALCLGACASAPDHFYTLNSVPQAQQVVAVPTLHVRLHVTLPMLVDRAEMVVNTSKNGILILDHERWAAPLSDQVLKILSRDLEARRSDVFVGDRKFDQEATPIATIKLEVVHMAVERAGHAVVEARWHVLDTGAGVDSLGSGAFDAAVAGSDYAAVARAYSDALSQLAERLARDVPHR